MMLERLRRKHSSGDLLWLVCYISTLRICLTDNNGLGHYIRNYEEVIMQEKPGRSEGELELLFWVFERPFDLLLRRNDKLFHSSMKVHVVSEKGIEEKDFDHSNYYVGTIRGASGSIVHGYYSNEYGFDGIIQLTEETYYVEPAQRFPSTSFSSPTVVYRLSDVVYNETVKFVFHGKLASALHMENFVSNHYRSRRGTRFDSNKNTCGIAVVADYEFFSGPGESSEATTISEMSYHIQQANTIFRNTEFSNEIQNIGFRIDKTIIYTTEDNPFDGNFQVDEFLDTFSELDFRDFCLAHLFAYKDFQNGVIGLAWVGDTSSGSGGVCETERITTRYGDRSLNTGFTTLFNYQRRVLRAVSTITTTHELGHNFGSWHDEASEECSPGEFGDSNGNYIMFASATDGSKSNNQQFSPCSKPVMADVISAKGGCFVAANPDPQCGNGVVEGDEECDCGSSDVDSCKAVDPCCNPGNCTLIEGAKCSPMAKACCNESCEFSMSLCRKQEECIYPTYCKYQSNCWLFFFGTGVSGDCEDPEYWEDNTVCNDGANTCIKGQCIGSVCAVWGVERCDCVTEEQLCHVCCLWDGDCVSTFDRHETDEKVNGSFIPPGTPCSDFMGYCDNTGTCKTVDNQSPLDDLKDFLGSISFNSIIEWLKENWQYVLSGFGGLFVVLVLFQVVYRRQHSDHDDFNDDDETRTLLPHDHERASLEESQMRDKRVTDRTNENDKPTDISSV
ncbi:disintegrin and metalloproteinase domain-containing protein 10-like [Corticium candelabrum]|uniref:disintegrin and metalloproteinase domain-containing protein 10-like n=1 Tax=Corticium candelabrum TaxID=121492 RepID=UPI002E25B5ED|nr:disintegrin and metalloproteinase domain-containing protein 10-like [Corticium candelabrum]